MTNLATGNPEQTVISRINTIYDDCHPDTKARTIVKRAIGFKDY